PSLLISHSVVDRQRGGGLDVNGLYSLTSITPRIRVVSRSGRVQGDVSYAPTATVRLGRRSDVSFSEALSARVRVDLVPDHVSINLFGDISAARSSAFAPQFALGTTGDPDQGTFRRFSIAPEAHTEIAGVVLARASAEASWTDTSTQASSTGNRVALGLGSSREGRVGWALDATRDELQFQRGRRITTDRQIASLLWRPDIDWQFAIRGGEERTNLTSVFPERYANWGGTVKWIPSQRTVVSLSADRRAFGDSHAILLQHRWRRSVFRFTDSRDVNDGLNQGSGGGGQGILAYDLFFALFASQQPDPALRDTLVRSFLDRAGIAADEVIGGGVVTSGVSLDRRQELSWTLQGQRTTYLAALFSTRSERIGVDGGGIDDLSFGPVSERGLRVTVSHQVSAIDSVNLTSEARRTKRDADGRYNTFTSLNAVWLSRLSDRTAVSLGVRRSQFDDSSNPYIEHAVTGTFTHQF
ncbi:MAG: TIGR03016 family PEP-CTERM system-associated outer membrane protein, partial [Rubrivivax sp.]